LRRSLSGAGALYGAFDIEAGGDGFMTGFAFPEALKAIVDAKNAGDEELVWKIYKHWLPLMVFEQQPYIIAPSPNRTPFRYLMRGSSF
jgi:4-hydroxy-tetrahydrodipicolinate synthase